MNYVFRHIQNSVKPLHTQLCHIQNPNIFIEPEASSKAYWTCKMITHIKNSLFKHFQVYLVIFRDTDALSVTLSHYSVCKVLDLKYLAVFWICFCLNNCSLIYTVTLCYTLKGFKGLHRNWIVAHTTAGKTSCRSRPLRLSKATKTKKLKIFHNLT